MLNVGFVTLPFMRYRYLKEVSLVDMQMNKGLNVARNREYIPPKDRDGY